MQRSESVINICYQNQALKFFESRLVTKPYLYGILLTIIRVHAVESQAKAYLKTLLNAELHPNSLVYRYIFSNRLDLFLNFN